MNRVPRRVRRAAAGLIAAAVVAVAIAFGAGGGTSSSPLPAASDVSKGFRTERAALNRPAPDFAALDVVSGKTLRRDDLSGRRTLMFFSEGASCQACLIQIRDLEPALRGSDLRLVSVSTDEPDVLAQTAREYGITTPMLSDATRRMSADYGMLGKGGMGHPDTDGHAFLLLDRQGTIRWARAYAEMYVPPKKLLKELP